MSLSLVDLDTILAFPGSQDPAAAFSAGGVLAAIDAEILRRDQATEKAVTCLRLYAAVSARLEDVEATRTLAASANPEDPGVRGPTGNKEGWLETIPKQFHRSAHTVFPDEAAAALPPHKTGLDCEIEIREGEKLSTSKVYDMSAEQLSTPKALLDVELAKGFIRPSSSSSSAPVFFVKDPSTKQLRLVVDYQDLNRKIKLDEYPIPLTRTVMARLPNAKIFTKFDVRSATSGGGKGITNLLIGCLNLANKLEAGNFVKGMRRPPLVTRYSGRRVLVSTSCSTI